MSEWTCRLCGAVLHSSGDLPPYHKCPAETPVIRRGKLAFFVAAALGLYLWFETGQAVLAIAAAIGAGFLAGTKLGHHLVSWALIIAIGWILLSIYGSS